MPRRTRRIGATGAARPREQPPPPPARWGTGGRGYSHRVVIASPRYKSRVAPCDTAVGPIRSHLSTVDDVSVIKASAKHAARRFL